MRKLLLFSIFAALLASTAVPNAEAAEWHHGHYHGHEHFHYVYYHGHRGYWNGVHFVFVEPAPAPIMVPAYYPQPYPPAYYAPAPVPAPMW